MAKIAPFEKSDPEYLARMRRAVDETQQIRAALARYPGGPKQIRAEQAARAAQDHDDKAPE